MSISIYVDICKRKCNYFCIWAVHFKLYLRHVLQTANMNTLRYQDSPVFKRSGGPASGVFPTDTPCHAESVIIRTTTHPISHCQTTVQPPSDPRKVPLLNSAFTVVRDIHPSFHCSPLPTPHSDGNLPAVCEIRPYFPSSSNSPPDG